MVAARSQYVSGMSRNQRPTANRTAIENCSHSRLVDIFISSGISPHPFRNCTLKVKPLCTLDILTDTRASLSDLLIVFLPPGYQGESKIRQSTKTPANARNKSQTLSIRCSGICRCEMADVFATRLVDNQRPFPTFQ